VTPPGIDPGTVRLLAQRLNHYTTPVFKKNISVIERTMSISLVVIYRNTRTVALNVHTEAPNVSVTHCHMLLTGQPT
jgi:hypothetical protein